MVAAPPGCRAQRWFRSVSVRWTLAYPRAQRRDHFLIEIAQRSSCIHPRGAHHIRCIGVPVCRERDEHVAHDRVPCVLVHRRQPFVPHRDVLVDCRGRDARHRERFHLGGHHPSIALEPLSGKRGRHASLHRQRHCGRDARCSLSGVRSEAVFMSRRLVVALVLSAAASGGSPSSSEPDLGITATRRTRAR